VKDLGPPSWIEEQRSILTFWRVQYFFELKVGRLKGRLGCASRDLGKLQLATIGTFYPGFEWQKVLTALDFIEELRTMGGLEQPSEPRNFGWSRSKHQFYLPNPEKGIDSGWTCEALPPSRAVGQDQLGQIREYLLEETTGWTFLTRISRALKTDPLRHLPIDPYRKFGVFLWDQKMMVDLELWPGRAFVDTKDGYNYFHPWRSNLSEHEVTQAVKDQEDEW
jgi:hypothetical protein